MSIKVQDYTCEGCGTEYSLRWDAESVDYKPDFCPFCADEIQQPEEKWDDVGMFYVDEDELEQ